MTKKIVPDPPIPALPSIPDNLPICFETRLCQASDLLNCASATAYECGDNLSGQPRALAMASMHLIAQAQSVIDLLLDHLPIVTVPLAPDPGDNEPEPLPV